MNLALLYDQRLTNEMKGETPVLFSILSTARIPLAIAIVLGLGAILAMLARARARAGAPQLEIMAAIALVLVNQAIWLAIFQVYTRLAMHLG